MNLKNDINIDKIGNDWVEITTPNLDRHNDYIQIFVKKRRDHYILTDAGYTLDDLEMSGCSINTPKHIELVNITLMRFGVYLSKDGFGITTEANAENFEIKKNDLINAILEINSLFN